MRPGDSNVHTGLGLKGWAATLQVAAAQTLGVHSLLSEPICPEIGDCYQALEQCSMLKQRERCTCFRRLLCPMRAVRAAAILDSSVAEMLNDGQYSSTIPVSASSFMGIASAANSSGAVPSYTLQGTSNT